MKILVLSLFLFLTIAVAAQMADDWIVAKQGDTARTLAVRNKIDPILFAKYNGVLPDTKLPAGRSLKRPPQPCVLEKAPEVRGLKLGMREDEANRLLGGDLRFNEYKGDREAMKLIFASLKTEAPIGFDGIRLVKLHSFDGKIYKIRIEYDNDVVWNNLGEFVKNFAPKLGLPLNGWQPDFVGATLSCNDFTVRLETCVNGCVEITDLAVIRAMRTKEMAADEEKKKAIKP